MSFGMGSSKGSSTSEGYGYNMSDAGSFNQSYVDPQQQAGMDQVRTGAMNQANQDNGVLAAQGRGQDSMNQIAGAQGQMANMAQTGGMAAQFAGGNQELQNRQISDLGTSMGNFFNEQLAPGIRGSAVAAGGMGGGRQQLAMGQAAGDVAEQYQQGVTGIMSNNYGMQQQAAFQADQNKMGAAGMQSSLAGMMSNLGMNDVNMNWSNLQNLQGLMGSPTVLNSGGSQAYSQSENTTSANSVSKSRNFSIGI
jgi:hypothetical protein